MQNSKRNQRLSGHRALITGASSGLGEQYAIQLAKQGADLVISARRTERLEKLATDLRQTYGVNVEVYPSDLSMANAAEELFKNATAKGDVTILINNAGAGPYSPFLETPLERHCQILVLNMTALTELTHHSALHMRTHRKPSFISNVASIAGFQGAPNFAVYSGTKHYVRVFSEILRHELKTTNINVSCLCPGPTLTEFSETNGQALKPSSKKMMMTAEEVVQLGIRQMLAGRSIIIPGLVNKIACFVPRFFPNAWSIAVAGMAMSTSVEVAKLPKPTEKSTQV